MKRQIRLAVVGYGHRGQSMFGLGSKFENIKPVAVCEIKNSLLEKAAADHPGIRHFSDFDEMLDKTEIDALLVETPAVNHAAFCIKALNRNIHVMSDIPCINSEKDTAEFWKAANKSKAIFMTGANPNMWAWVDSAMNLKEQGLLGSPYYIEAEYIHDIRSLFEETPWRKTYESIKYCTHSLGPVLRLIDEDLESVTCFDTGSHINREEGQHDAMAALFRTKSNVVIRLLTSFINNRPGCFHCYKFYTTEGYFERTPDYGDGQKTLLYSKKLYTDKKLFELPVSFMKPEYAKSPVAAAGHGGADYALFDKFFDAVRGNKPSPIPLKEGIRMSLPGIIAAKSAEAGGKLMKITYPWQK